MDQLSSNQYANIINLLDNDDWDKALFSNQNIKDKLNNEFFTFINFKKMKDIWNNLIKEMNDDKDEKYTE